ncbi:MAG: hypothetical protein ABI637_05190 [Gemmatimonadota bacterium]
MSHLTMEALLALREPGIEPGEETSRRHLEECAACRAELERLHQRVAHLKALPALRPARDLWPEVRARYAAEHGRVVRKRWTAMAGFLAAASVAVVVIGGGMAHPEQASAAAAIAAARERSQVLETALREYDPDTRMIDGRTARMSLELEIRIAAVDSMLQEVQLERMQQVRSVREDQMLELWRERVGLLDALVDVHVTRASNVGL